MFSREIDKVNVFPFDERWRVSELKTHFVYFSRNTLSYLSPGDKGGVWNPWHPRVSSFLSTASFGPQIRQKIWLVCECFPWKEMRFGYQMAFHNLMCVLEVKCWSLWIKLCGPGTCFLKVSIWKHLPFSRWQFSWLKNNVNEHLGWFFFPKDQITFHTKNILQQPDFITNSSWLHLEITPLVVRVRELEGVIGYIYQFVHSLIHIFLHSQQ